MSYLLDTNVISELRKGPRADPGVTSWVASVPVYELFTSVLVLAEMRRGVEIARRRDRQKAAVLEHWLHDIDRGFRDRMLGIDRATAEEWGYMAARRPRSDIDALLAATAKVHRYTLVTRNAKDVADLGVDVLDPFTAGSRR